MDPQAMRAAADLATAPARWRRFLAAWAAAVVALLALVAALNVAVDPFFVFGTPLIPGFNVYKPATQGREALAKPPLLARMQPRTVLIGTSKIQVGIDPFAVTWPAGEEPVFNAGLPGSTSPVTLAIVQDALATAPVKRVVVFLEPVDLVEAATPFHPAGPYRHAGWARMRDLVDATLTRDALTASLRTLVAQWAGMPTGLHPDGQMYDGVFRAPALAEGPGSLFGEKTPLQTNKIAGMARRLAAEPGAGFAQLDVVREIIALCRAKGVRLDMALAPLHADTLRLFELAGLWPRYLAMREALAQLVPEAAGGQVRLMNFSGFDAYSTEAVPPVGQHAALLRWFWEQNHFRPEYGRLVMAAINGEAGSVGTVLTPGDVEALNQGQTAAMEQDRAAQPAEWARMAAALAVARAEADKRR